MPPGLQSRLGFVNSGAGGFDSHALPPLPLAPRPIRMSRALPHAGATITIRPYRPGDEHAILATFNRVFARTDPAFVPRTIEHVALALRAESVAAARVMLAVEDGGEVLAQYAGAPACARGSRDATRSSARPSTR